MSVSACAGMELTAKDCHLPSANRIGIMKTTKESKTYTNKASVWKWMKGSRILYFFGIISIGLSTLIMMARPLILTYSLDTTLGGMESTLPEWFTWILSRQSGSGRNIELLWNASVFLLLTIAGGYFMYLKGILTARASEKTAMKMRNQLYEHLQSKTYEYHVKVESGDIMQRCTSDVETVRVFFAGQLTEIGRAFFILAIASFIMVELNVKMMFIAIALMPLIFLFSFYFFKKVRKKFKEVDEAEGALSNVIQENLTGIRVVRAFARQDFEIDKYEKKNGAFRDRIYELLRIVASFWAISDWICLMQISLVIVIGGYWAASGTITLGMYIAFIAYVERLLWPIRQMGRILTDMGKMFVARDRIGKVLQEDDNEFAQEEGLEPAISGGIEFRNVSFSYDKHHPILSNISFTVKPGETVAILGPTGSGKSTLIHLLARLYEPTEGEIFIDGIPIKDIKKKYLRDHVGIVLQEPFLFNKSVKDNISLARKKASEKEIFETAATAAVHSVIMKFDKKYDTEVGEGGVTLSGGQKQRIAIARILIKNPPVLVFDDSLSAVDTITDESIRRELKKRERKSTTFIISHRITTLSEADKIIVLEDGSISAVGSHKDLISRDGLYQRIWNIQSAVSVEAGK
ncbi:MAG: ABC transporter ATP-binding protein [Spirochaetales bacterium]|nr:ABC transporter ATP-binding protein [Spirochaetales bacterium]